MDRPESHHTYASGPDSISAVSQADLPMCNQLSYPAIPDVQPSMARKGALFGGSDLNQPKRLAEVPYDGATAQLDSLEVNENLGHEQRRKQSLFDGLLRLARPRQWIKNLLVFVAPVAGGALLRWTVLWHAGAAFGIFAWRHRALTFSMTPLMQRLTVSIRPSGFVLSLWE